MKNKIFSLLCFLSLQGFSQILGVDTLIKNGPVGKRINLVIMGDGYTAAQMTQFITNATASANYLFSTSPFSTYKKYFNVFAIRVASPQSGISHPGTATDVTEPQSPTLSVTNNFNTRFDNYNIHRNIYAMNPVAVYSVLAVAFPAYDQVLILGNSTEYGGAGGSYAVSSIHASANEIVVHELGHSFAGLADEYWAGPGYAIEKPNMTNGTFTSSVKWAPWVGTSNVGIYPHGTVTPASNWFKPHQNCKMEFLNAPFCGVCKQTIIEKIHSLVNPVDSFYPDNSSTIVPTAPTQWFKGTFVRPAPYTLRRIWEVNGDTVARNKDSVLVNNNSYWQGSNTVKLSVMDTTFMSRDANHETLHSYAVVWDVSYSTVGIKTIKPELELSVFPNPASERIRIRFQLFQDSDITLSVIDPVGKVIREEPAGRLASGAHERSWDISEMKAGSYVLALKINNKTINTKFIITK